MVQLYEMLHLMGDDYVDVFMAIRTVTQHSVKYFVERREEIWAALDTDFPEMERESAERETRGSKTTRKVED